MPLDAESIFRITVVLMNQAASVSQPPDDLDNAWNVSVFENGGVPGALHEFNATLGVCLRDI
jgi:hypothetical protein